MFHFTYKWHSWRQKLEQKINKSTTAINHVLPLVEPYGLQPNDLNRKSGRELRRNFRPSPCWSLSIILSKWWRRDKFHKWDVLIPFFTCTVRLRAFLKRFWSKTKLPILRFEIWGPVQNMLPFMNVCHLVCFQILFWLNFWPQCYFVCFTITVAVRCDFQESQKSTQQKKKQPRIIWNNHTFSVLETFQLAFSSVMVSIHCLHFS